MGKPTKSSNHPFVHRVFHEINHSILGVLPLFLETSIYTYLDVPRGVEWMIRGPYTPSLRVQTAPFGRCWYTFTRILSGYVLEKKHEHPTVNNTPEHNKHILDTDDKLHNFDMSLGIGRRVDMSKFLYMIY